MNVYPLIDAEYAYLKDAALAALRPCGAFVRADRGSALFVSDAPRHGVTAIPALEALFMLRFQGNLLFLSPRLPDVPEALRALYLRLLKAAPETRDRALCEALAECLRLHRAEDARFLERIFEGGK